MNRFKYIQSGLLGAVVTVSLFYLMQAFIHSDASAFSDGPRGRLIDFVRVRDEAEVDTRQKKPERPPEQEPPPEQPDVQIDTDVNDLGIDIGNVDINAGINISFDGGFTNDGEYLPIVKVAPIYPRRAQTRGIEGYVLLEFTVTATGAVRDPVVLEAKPPSMFDRAAVQAALKFKYKPKVVNGEAIEVPGVQNLITFKLEG